VPLVMVVNPSVPAKTVPEFIAYAKANPDYIIMASVGNGTTPHMAGELRIWTAHRPPAPLRYDVCATAPLGCS
jgi:tripartite-type tricarboxylate transporter receptor subunit TctC